MNIKPRNAFGIVKKRDYGNNLILTKLWCVCISILLIITILGAIHKNTEILQIDARALTVTITNPKEGGAYLAYPKKLFNFNATDNNSPFLTITATLVSPDGGSIIVHSGDPFPTNPGEYRLDVKVVNETGNNVVRSINFAILGYIVMVEGSIYVANTQIGALVSSNKDFGAIMNNLNGLLQPGDVVLIKNGTYTVTTPININKSHITIRGEGSSILVASSLLNSTYMMDFNQLASNDLLEKVIFDANNNRKISPVLSIDGNYITVQYCKLKNAMQYGFEAYLASDFQFLHNNFITAQYAIATGGSASIYAANGVIAYNTIKDCSDVGIKLRWVKNTSVHDNDIDTAYITQPLNTAFTPSGIRFYHADGPTNNVTVSNNRIYDSQSTSVQHTVGIFVDNDARRSSTGQKIIGNQINNCYFGVYNNWNNIVIENNTFMSCTDPIQDNGSETIKFGNIILP